MQHLRDELYLSLPLIGDLQPKVERLDHLDTNLLALNLTDVVVWLSQNLENKYNLSKLPVLAKATST